MPPRHIVSASGFITNDAGEVLLVRTYWRGDTWEMPGGQVEEGETPQAALIREVREETGIEVRPYGVTGVYSNPTGGIINLVFRAEAIGEELRTSPETQEVRFVELTSENARDYITRPHFLSRTLDAMQGIMAAYEAFIPSPHQVLERLDRQGDLEKVEGLKSKPNRSQMNHTFEEGRSWIEDR